MTLEDAESVLLDFALTLPEAVEEFPWGGQERVVKVNKKIFAFISVYPFPKTAPPKLRVGVKLPDSHEGALAMPFTQAMGYNRGKSRWVLAGFWADDHPPISLLMDWIEESTAPSRPTNGWHGWRVIRKQFAVRAIRHRPAYLAPTPLAVIPRHHPRPF
jgi:predicted DNA-binding protein (MmcQ/YjbR family)